MRRGAVCPDAFVFVREGASGEKASRSIEKASRSIENGLNPRAYLQYLLERLPGVDPKDAASIDSLLPWSDPVQSALKPVNPTA